MKPTALLNLSLAYNFRKTITLPEWSEEGEFLLSSDAENQNVFW